MFLHLSPYLSTFKSMQKAGTPDITSISSFLNIKYNYNVVFINKQRSVKKMVFFQTKTLLSHDDKSPETALLADPEA